MGQLKGGLAKWQAAHKKGAKQSTPTASMTPADMAISKRIEKATGKKMKKGC